MKHNTKMFMLAILVVVFFFATAIAISFLNYWAMALLFFAGLATMGYGLTLKRKHREANRQK